MDSRLLSLRSFAKIVGIFLRDRPTTATSIREAGCDWTPARPRWCAHAPAHSLRMMCGVRFFPPCANAVAAAYVSDHDARAAKHTRPPPPPFARTHTHQCLCDCLYRWTPSLTLFVYLSSRYQSSRLSHLCGHIL